MRYVTHQNCSPIFANDGTYLRKPFASYFWRNPVVTLESEQKIGIAVCVVHLSAFVSVFTKFFKVTGSTEVGLLR